MKTKKINSSIIILLFYMVFIRPIGTMFDSASLPAIAHYFHATVQKTQASVFTFIFFSMIAPLIYGTLSDKFGRKKLFMAGMMLFSISSFLSIFALNINQIIILRAFQGLGLGCEFAVSASIIKDYVGKGKRLSYGYSASEIVYGLASLALPFLGAVIQQYSGWKACYLFMGISTLILCILYSQYKESNELLQKIKINKLFLNHFLLLKNLKYACMIIVIGTLSSFMYLFYCSIPFIFENIFKQSPMFFGTTSLIVSVVYVLSVIINVVLLRIMKDNNIISLGIIIIVVSVIMLFLLNISNSLNIVLLITLISSINLGIGLSYANMHSLLVSLFPDFAGTVNSQIKFSFSFFGWAFTTATVLFSSKSSLNDFIFLYIIIAVIISLFYLFSFIFNKKEV